MREAFSSTLVQLARQDSRVLLLTGDHGYALFDEFRRACPRQYVNAGVAEQNMVGMSAGLARMGFRPFVYGLSAFVPVRVVEQIKLDVAHDELPVVFIGDGAGFVYSHLGTSHQSTEDIACTRAIPGLALLSPADRHEMLVCMRYAHTVAAPVYLRMGKADRDDVHAGPLDLYQSGDLVPLRGSTRSRTALIATGSMVRTAVTAVRSGIDASVWSVPQIKPINAAQVCDIARACTSIVTLEEHSTSAGMGSLIAEICSEHVPRRILRIGVADRFSEFCGSYSYLLKEHGLDDASVIDRITRFISGDSGR